VTDVRSWPSLYDFLGVYVRRFVRWWRRFDAFVNQPLPSGRAWYWTWLAPDGYSWFAPVLSIVLIVIMALGPAPRFGAANIGLLLFGLVLLLLLHIGVERRRSLRQYLLAGQIVILCLQALILFLVASPANFNNDTGSLRLHVGFAVAIALALSLGGAWLLALALFRPTEDRALAHALPQVELFRPNNRYDFIGRGPIVALISALVIVPIRYPVELLFPGSLMALFVPDRYLGPVFFTLMGIAWLALFLGTLFERLMEILETVGRLFFIGPQYAISILVIVIAILRLMHVHYVTYLFNSGSGGYGNFTIMAYFTFIYVAAMYYAFWSQHFVAWRMIGLLNQPPGPHTPSQIDYPFEGDDQLSRVRADGRTIAVHGAGRLKIQGEYESGYEASGVALQFQTPRHLLDRFRRQAEQLPKEATIPSDSLPSLNNLHRSVLAYPLLTSLLVVLILGIPTGLTFFLGVQPPELEVRESHAIGLSPATLLLAGNGATGVCSELAPDEPRIALAASGGGTRAAMYTASILRGIAEQGKICNVVLVSGVSGGSAALAYFALHENELRRAGALNVEAWDRFSEIMSYPFIEDVIKGASDLRIILGRRTWRNTTCGETQPDEGHVSGWLPARSRLGSILAESFVCELGSGLMKDPSFGLILNTAMLGSFDPAKCIRAADLPLADQAQKCRDQIRADVAGGRLVLSNLVKPSSDQSSSETAQMKIVWLNDADISIARAAALSANFPPVFPDAAIDRFPSKGSLGVRYLVTDGGAVENRGAVTLYLSVREALKVAKPSHLPPLLIVIADASAPAGNYSESFGFGSVLNAGGQLGLGMEGEMLSDLKQFYCDRGSSVSAFEVTMPSALRSGGIGTHWLLPGSLTFDEPEGRQQEGTRQQVILSAADVKKVVLSLNGTNHGAFDDPKAANTLLKWAKSDPDYQKHWRNLRQHLVDWSRSRAKCSKSTKGGFVF
jgi:hypothetical protein